jgi:hypothetical protein
VSVRTTTNPLAFGEDYERREMVSSATKALSDSDAQTRVLGRAVDRFQLTMLPFAAAATVAMSTMLGDRRFLMSTMASSRTQSIAPSAWLDDWVFTTEGATLADVAALNSLLALPAVEGLVLDYPDE